MNKIQKFIKDNDLDFSGSGSGLNGACVILAGYALYENGDANDYEKLQEDIEEGGLYDLTSEAQVELERVFDYAYSNNYAQWWTTEEARSAYVYESKEAK